MNQQEFEPLIQYIKNWQSIDGIKPLNEQVFITEFLKLINNFPDEREVEFNGEGSYFGRQVTLKPYSFYGKSPRELEFEVSYSRNKISVYTANHHGFWNPEYLCITSDDMRFNDIYSEWICFLKGVFGI